MTHQRTVASLFLCLLLTFCCGVMTVQAEMKSQFWPLMEDEVLVDQDVEVEQVIAAQFEVIAAHIEARGEATTDPTSGMAFVSIDSGCFQMGNDKGDVAVKPVHKVCVERFSMGQYEVTQQQWQAIMGDNPSRFNQGGNYPVERVSWDDVQTYIEKLNQRGDGRYRLPTEAEWEYAARAGQDDTYSGGNKVDDVAWYDGNSDDSTHRVGEKQPNAFGLYDMSGNVGEWCSDWYSDDYYGDSPSDNPQGPSSGESHSYRGGGWFDYAWALPSTVRAGGKKNYRYSGLGVRLVFSPNE